MATVAKNSSHNNFSGVKNYGQTFLSCTTFQNESTQNMINIEAFNELNNIIKSPHNMKQIEDKSSFDDKKHNLEAYIEILKYFLSNTSNIHPAMIENLNKIIHNNGRAIFNYMKDGNLDTDQIKSNLEICWFKILIIELEKQSLDNSKICEQSEFKEYPIIIQYLTDISENSSKSQTKNALFNTLIKLKIKPKDHNFREKDETGKANLLHYLYYLESSGESDSTEYKEYIDKLIELVNKTCTITGNTMQFNEKSKDIDDIVNGIFGEIESSNNTNQAESLISSLVIPSIDGINTKSEYQEILTKYNNIAQEYIPFQDKLKEIMLAIYTSFQSTTVNISINNIIINNETHFEKILDYLIKITQYLIFLLATQIEKNTNTNIEDLTKSLTSIIITLDSLNSMFDSLPKLKKKIYPYLILYDLNNYEVTPNTPNFNGFELLRKKRTKLDTYINDNLNVEDKNLLIRIKFWYLIDFLLQKQLNLNLEHLNSEQKDELTGYASFRQNPNLLQRKKGDKIFGIYVDPNTLVEVPRETNFIHSKPKTLSEKYTNLLNEYNKQYETNILGIFNEPLNQFDDGKKAKFYLRYNSLSKKLKQLNTDIKTIIGNPNNTNNHDVIQLKDLFEKVITLQDALEAFKYKKENPDLIVKTGGFKKTLKSKCKTTKHKLKMNKSKLKKTHKLKKTDKK
jgi:hypothetical protein